MPSAILKEKLHNKEFVFAPGIQDMITAVIANKVGFDVIYASGYWLTASGYGLPDAGIATFTQMLDRVSTLVDTSKAAVVADADTGYGGLLNVHHTVKGYERAGVTGIQFEDQEFPKKCVHTPFRRVIAATEMVDKIKVAVDAREDENLVIIARTDALDSEGLNAAIDRVGAYREAGADVLFIEALPDDAQMRDACERVNGPMMVNMSNGGSTQQKSQAQMIDLGFSMAIAPSLTSLAAAAAAEQALRAFKEQAHGEPEGISLFDFNEFCSLIGFQEVWEFERRWSQIDD